MPALAIADAGADEHDEIAHLRPGRCARARAGHDPRRRAPRVPVWNAAPDGPVRSESSRSRRRGASQLSEVAFDLRRHEVQPLPPSLDLERRGLPLRRSPAVSDGLREHRAHAGRSCPSPLPCARGSSRKRRCRLEPASAPPSSSVRERGGIPEAPGISKPEAKIVEGKNLVEAPGIEAGGGTSRNDARCPESSRE